MQINSMADFLIFHIHFQGECKYMLVQTKDFEVHHGNEVRRNNPVVTWTKEVMVIFKDSEYSLNKGRIFNVSNSVSSSNSIPCWKIPL